MQVKAPILYSALEMEEEEPLQRFKGNGKGFLSDAISCLVTETINADFELEMQYPISGLRDKNIQIGDILLAPAHPYTENPFYDFTSTNPNTENWQPFRIYSISKTSENVIRINAEHINYELTGYPCLPNDEYKDDNDADVETIVTYINNQARSVTQSLGLPRYNFFFDNAIDKKSAWEISAITDIRSAMLYAAYVFDGEWEFNELDCKLWKRRGGKRKTTVRYGENMQFLKVSQRSDLTYTHIFPFWKKDDKSVYAASGGYVEVPNAPESVQQKVLILDLTDRFDEEPSYAELVAAAKQTDAYLNPPQIEDALDVQFLIRGRTTEYAQYDDELDHVELGDVVDVVADPYGVETEARCYKTVYNVLLGIYDKIAVGDVKQVLTSSVEQAVKAVEEDKKQTRDRVIWYSVTEPTENVRSGDIWIRINNDVDRIAQAWGELEGGSWLLKCKFAQGGGVGRNVGGHNEIFNVNEGEPDSNTISLTGGDQNTARGKNNQIHGYAYQCETSGLNNKILGWSNRCTVGGIQNQLGADDDNAYHNSVTMYGDDNIFIGNIQYSFIDGRSNRGTGGHIFNSIISGEQNAVVTEGIDDSILIGFKNTVNDVRRSFIGGSQNYVEDAIDSVIVGLNNQVIQPQHAIVCGQGANGNIATMYIVAGSVFTVDRYGAVKAAGGYSSMGADYAEMFEWADGNPANEDRRGMLVTLSGDKIIPAHGDDFIGIISANPSVIGNNPMHWPGKYKTDVFGGVIYDSNGDAVLSEEYDPKREYIPRSERPEWAAVGLTGRLVVVDDGSCIPSAYISARQGTATKCYKNTGACVLRRIDEKHIEVLIK